MNFLDNKERQQISGKKFYIRKSKTRIFKLFSIKKSKKLFSFHFRSTCQNVDPGKSLYRGTAWAVIKQLWAWLFTNSKKKFDAPTANSTVDQI